MMSFRLPGSLRRAPASSAGATGRSGPRRYRALIRGRPHHRQAGFPFRPGLLQVALQFFPCRLNDPGFSIERRIVFLQVPHILA